MDRGKLDPNTTVEAIIPEFSQIKVLARIMQRVDRCAAQNVAFG
jgi:hypothetical protein